MSAAPPSPAIVAIDHDPASLEQLRSVLERRFGADYDIVTEQSALGGLALLQNLHALGTDVALVLAEQWLPDRHGVELLEQVPAIYRDARRGLLIAWGERTTAEWIVKASALGQIDGRGSHSRPRR